MKEKESKILRKYIYVMIFAYEKMGIVQHKINLKFPF